MEAKNKESYLGTRPFFGRQTADPRQQVDSDQRIACYLETSRWVSEWSVLICGAGKWVQVQVISNQVRVSVCRRLVPLVAVWQLHTYLFCFFVYGCIHVVDKCAELLKNRAKNTVLIWINVFIFFTDVFTCNVLNFALSTFCFRV